MEVDLALARFTGQDEQQARDGYDWLFARYRGYVHYQLMKWLPAAPGSSEIRDEVVQNTFLNLWRARAKFVVQGEPQWRAFLKRTAYRCCIDFLRAEASQNPPTHLEPADDLAATEEDAGRLYDCANTVLLELDPALSVQTHHRQLLAARLYYLENESWESICRLLPPTSLDQPSLTRSQLSAWLMHPGVVRYLAFDLLYYSNDRLVAHLLGVEEGCDAVRRTRFLAALMRRAIQERPEEPAIAGWSWAEIQALLWRYRYALSIDEIIAFETCALVREEILALTARSEARFPFYYQMERLLAGLQRSPSLDPREIFGAPLWQRLALQYHYCDELTYDEIEARMGPAATQVDYPVRAVTMPTWLSISSKHQGRVIKRLASQCPGLDETGSEQ